MKKPDGTATLQKCLTVFTRIATDHGNSPLARLVDDLVLPRATLYRITGALARAGMIARLKPGYYRIGLTLTEQAAVLSPKAQLIDTSRPLLRRLALACRATAHLGVMENDMVTYLVKESGSAPSAVAFTNENSQLEAYCSGIGKVLLAWLPEDEQERYLSGGLFVAITPRTITEPGRLRACLQNIRTRKFARDDGEIAENVYCLAVPLWTSAPMTAAISLSFKREQIMDDENYLARLRRAALAISLKLGK